VQVATALVVGAAFIFGDVVSKPGQWHGAEMAVLYQLGAGTVVDSRCTAGCSAASRVLDLQLPANGLAGRRPYSRIIFSSSGSFRILYAPAKVSWQ